LARTYNRRKDGETEKGEDVEQAMCCEKTEGGIFCGVNRRREKVTVATNGARCVWNVYMPIRKETTRRQHTFIFDDSRRISAGTFDY